MIKYAIFYTILLLLLPALFAGACKLTGCSFKNGSPLLVIGNMSFVIIMAVITFYTYGGIMKIDKVSGFIIRFAPILATVFTSILFGCIFVWSALEEESEENYEEQNI